MSIASEIERINDAKQDIKRVLKGTHFSKITDDVRIDEYYKYVFGAKYNKPDASRDDEEDDL